MGHAVDDRAAHDRADVEGQVALIVRQVGHGAHDVGQLDDGVRAPLVHGAGVAAAPLHLDVEAGHALAGGHELIAVVHHVAALEDERGQRALQALAGQRAEVGSQDFLGGVQEDVPGGSLENLREGVAQPVEEHVDQHRAALDVHRAGAVNAVAGNAKMEVVGLFLQLGEDRVEVGDEADGRGGPAVGRRAAGAGQQQVAAELKAVGLNRLALEAKVGEAVGGQLAQAIDAARVQGEAIDEHHLVQQVEIDGPVVVQVGAQFGVGGGGVHGAVIALKRGPFKPPAEFCPWGLHFRTDVLYYVVDTQQ